MIKTWFKCYVSYGTGTPEMVPHFTDITAKVMACKLNKHALDFIGF